MALLSNLDWSLILFGKLSNSTCTFLLETHLQHLNGYRTWSLSPPNIVTLKAPIDLLKQISFRGITSTQLQELQAVMKCEVDKTPVLAEHLKYWSKNRRSFRLPRVQKLSEAHKGQRLLLIKYYRSHWICRPAFTIKYYFNINVTMAYSLLLVYYTFKVHSDREL